jgi:hypothetical protein
MVVSTVQGFQMVEEIVRKLIHSKVLELFASIAEKMQVPGCGVLIEKISPKDEEDEFGWAKQGGGFQKWRSQQKGGGGGVMDLVNEILTPDIQAKLEEVTGPVLGILESYMAASSAAAEEWSSRGPATQDPEQSIVDRAPDGVPDGLPAAAEIVVLDDAAVPAAVFQKAGLKAAMKELQPVLEELGGPITERVKTIMLTMEQRSTDMRRGLSQLVQELVVSKVRDEIFPKIDEAIDKHKKIRGPIAKKVKGVVYDLAEGGVRKKVQAQITASFSDLSAKLAPDGAAVAPEEGEEQEEDDFGFLVSEGGYKKFKGSGGGLPDPMQMAQKIVDPETIEKLKQHLTNIKAPIQALQDAAETEKEKWLSENPKIRKMLNKAEKNTKKLAKLEVPTMEFVKAGLKAALEQLQPQLEELGGPLAERASSIMAQLQQRCSDMRRGVGQLLQELVVSKIRDKIFPELTEKVRELVTGLNLKIGAAKVQGNVQEFVFDMAERLMRKEVHTQLGAVFKDLTAKLAPAGCGVAPEPGIEAEEDEYGFLVSKGGFKKFQANAKKKASALAPNPKVVKRMEARKKKLEAKAQKAEAKALKAEAQAQKKATSAESVGASSDWPEEESTENPLARAGGSPTFDTDEQNDRMLALEMEMGGQSMKKIKNLKKSRRTAIGTSLNNNRPPGKLEEQDVMDNPLARDSSKFGSSTFDVEQLPEPEDPTDGGSDADRMLALEMELGGQAMDNTKGSKKAPGTDKLNLSQRVRGGEDGEEDDEKDAEMSPEEAQEADDIRKAKLIYDKSFLKANSNHIVKKYMELGGMLDDWATMKVSKRKNAAAVEGMFDNALQELMYGRLCLAIDPEIQSTLGGMHFTPPGEELERLMPDLFKKILTKGIEQLLEGMVREQVHKVSALAFDTVVKTFKSTIPGLDGDDEEEEEELDEDGNPIPREEGDGGKGHLGGGTLSLGTDMASVATTGPLVQVLDPRFMNRVMYQVTHISDSLKVYTEKASEAQQDWFHLEGKLAIEAGPNTKGKTSKKSKKQSKQEKFQANQFPIPIYQFHKSGLMAAKEKLQEGIDHLDDKVKTNLAVKYHARNMELTMEQVASEMRNDFEALALAYVLAHSKLAVDPELQRRLDDLEISDPAELAELESEAHTKIEEALEDATNKSIKGSYDNLGHSLVIPGTIAVFETGDTDERFGGCKICGKELQVYEPAHPQYTDIGVVDEWDCDVCAKSFTGADKLFACGTFKDCDWGACETCQILIQPTGGFGGGIALPSKLDMPDIEAGFDEDFVSNPLVFESEGVKLNSKAVNKAAKLAAKQAAIDAKKNAKALSKNAKKATQSQVEELAGERENPMGDVSDEDEFSNPLATGGSPLASSATFETELPGQKGFVDATMIQGSFETEAPESLSNRTTAKKKKKRKKKKKGDVETGDET